MEIPPSTAIGVRSLRASLPEVLRRAEAGQATTVTRGSRPVARIAPLGEEAPSLDGLVNSGGVIPPRRTSPWRAPEPVPVWAGVRIDQVLRELRG
jgi:prevent-host-death family protein